MGDHTIRQNNDQIDRSGISLDSQIKFYPIGTCFNCHSNLWSKDNEYRLRSGRERFYCFYCGADWYPDALAVERIIEVYIA